MSDLEIATLCAQAMGVPLMGSNVEFYDPMLNDVQAMALVKTFKLILIFNTQNLWMCQTENDETRSHDANLNRAICECVAKMQTKKSKPIRNI